MQDLTEEECEVLGLVLRDSRENLMANGHVFAKTYGVDPTRFIAVIEGLLAKFRLPREVRYPGTESQDWRASKGGPLE